MARLQQLGGTGSGTGGTVTVNSPGAIQGNATVNASALGSGAGGNLTLAAGVSGSGSLTTGVTLTAFGSGAANGGTITLSCAGIGSITAGDIASDAKGSGNAGNIAFSNSTSSSLTVNLNGTVSANATTGAPGSITFLDPGQSVSVSGSGGITGIITANGSSVTVNAEKAGIALIFASVMATNGDISLSAPGAGSKINFPLPVQVSATGNVTVDAAGNVDIGSTPGSKDDISGFDITIKGKDVTVDGQLNSSNDVTIGASGPFVLRMTTPR